MSPEGEGFTPSHRETATAKIMAPDGCRPAGKAGPASAREPWVFSTANGKRWRNNVWRDFRRIVKRAGLPESLRVQDLRTTVNSGTADDGFDGEARRQITGHKTQAVQDKRYRIVSDRAWQKAAQRLTARLRGEGVA